MLCFTWVLLCCLLALPVQAEQVCKFDSIRRSTPQGTFQDNGDGTVTDARYGLMWRHCAEGQSWDGETCIGDATLYNWQEALELAAVKSFAGHADWRLPNIKELATIVEEACYEPAIDLNAFPATPEARFWSSSPFADAEHSQYARIVNFSSGYSSLSSRNNSDFDNYTRLVRNGQALSLNGALNDTGIDWGGDYESGNNLTCTSNIAAPQDCHQGRDANADDDADGHAGFSFIALDSTGAVTTGSPACVQDQVTGLMWEVKTDDDGLHDKDDKYTWYNPDPTTNGGAVGYENNASAICFGYQAGMAATYCNTYAYVNRVNTVGWCGYQDWRLPTKEELHSIADFSRIDPTIDTTYFPQTPGGFWSSSPEAGNTTRAWFVSFSTGYDSALDRSTYFPSVRLVRGGQALPFASLESPQQGSFESGIGLIRGWVCNADTVEIQIDNDVRRQVAYGTSRGDTRSVCNDDGNNGFGFTYNWSLLSDGTHRLRAFADNVQFADVNFTVTTLGATFLQGVSGEYAIVDFPYIGDTTSVRWAEPHQNFVIANSTRSLSWSSIPKAAAIAALESPQPDSFESGIGLIRGWVCEAEIVEIQIDDGVRRRVAYGASRGDTRQICNDDGNNGFGFTYNWNLLGNGTHMLRAFADDIQFADIRFTVTTLGATYLEGISGEYSINDFPQSGQTTNIRWAEPHQNFIISP